MENQFRTTDVLPVPGYSSVLRAEAAKLQSILNNGATSVTTDGVTVQYDLDACRRRLREINRIINPLARPRAASVNLGGF
ncbi:MAG TPA: hypothetical protein VHQ47_17995 [Phycisphaerae bacterium]|nr:hypothetical protein [Phycisphaerae bacterium]